MCGIVGFVDNVKNKKKIIKNMSKRIEHRGPDGEGYYTDDLVAFGQRRLSIIDLEGGKQPMYDKDEKLVVIFNGEIYNYKELKEELSDYPFQTNSDTEVLLYGYKEWGTDLPKHLRGMFAFALWDIENKRLFCARDHFGIKPFYYGEFDGCFMFASEIKSFLEHPKFKKELNKEIIPSYLSFSFTPTTETLFKGVKRLDAGCSLIYENNTLIVDRYFDLSFSENDKNLEENVKIISEVMKDSVEHHMISDVEVGSFLSSGIDSSYLVSLAKPDKTYTVGYDIPRYNEIDYAKDLADRLGIQNTCKKITKEEYMEVLPKIMYHMDEPASDPAAVALYFVANLASKDLKVVLSGEGADEFFGGYNYYREEIDYKFYNKIPFFIRNLISRFFSLLPEIRGINFLVRRGQKLEDHYIGVNKVFSDKEAKKILTIPVTLTNKEITRPVYEKFSSESNIIKMQAIDINFWLMKDILQKADRMTMANSLEGRVPFIDIEVFKVASQLPFDFKVTKENTKVALREAAKEVIPNESYKKKKLGFPVPIRDWMKDDDVYKEILATFNQEYVLEFFNRDYLVELLDQHKDGKKDNYRKVWNVYCFIKWYEVFFVDNN